MNEEQARVNLSSRGISHEGVPTYKCIHAAQLLDSGQVSVKMIKEFFQNNVDIDLWLVREENVDVINAAIDEAINSNPQHSHVRAFVLGRVVRHFKAHVNIPILNQLVNARFSNVYEEH